MTTSRPFRQRLAVVGAGLALTAAAIALFKPLREFYIDLVVGSVTMVKVENLASTAAEMLDQRRFEEAQAFLENALVLRPRDHDLRLQLFYVETLLQFAEATDFETSYNAGKHNLLSPLQARGYRLARAARDDREHSSVLSYLGLLHYFDPVSISVPRLQALLEQATTLDSSNALAWTTRGFLAQREGEVDRAVQYWARAVQQDTGEIPAWQALGNFYLDRRDYRAAFEAFSAAFRSEGYRLGHEWDFRIQNNIRNQLATVLLEDLYSLGWGDSILGLDAAERLALLEEFRLDDWLLKARALAAVGDYERAAELGWQGLAAHSTRYGTLTRFHAHTLLRELDEHIAIDAGRKAKLAEDWEQAKKQLDLTEISPPGEPGTLWVAPPRSTVIRIDSGSRLFRSGLRIGDDLVGIGGIAIDTPGDIPAALAPAAGAPPGLLVSRYYRPVLLKIAADELL